MNKKFKNVYVFYVDFLRKFITTKAFTYKQKLAKTHGSGTENSNVAPQTHCLTILKK